MFDKLFKKLKKILKICAAVRLICDSAGAVVAREYGLPCVVGALKATQSFRSGETVILDGIQGTITRVSDQQN